MEEIIERRYDLWEYHSAIPKEICEQLIKKYNCNELEHGIISNQKIDLNVRNVKTFTLEKTDWVTSIFHYYGFDANHENFHYRIQGISNVQFLKYEPGMFYKVHSDTSPERTSESFYRKLTIVLSLSEPSDYEGGDFFLYADGLNKIKLNQQQGSIHVFPSYLNHKINPIKKGVRYSMVSWILGEPFS